MSSTLQNTSVTHPTLLARIGDVQVRTMIDTGASSSYICPDVTKLGLQPTRKERRCIEQMCGSITKIVEVNVTVESTIENGFKIDLECINAEKPILTKLPNPNVEEVKKQQPRLRRLKISEAIAPPLLGNKPKKDPGEEFTMLGWTL